MARVYIINSNRVIFSSDSEAEAFAPGNWTYEGDNSPAQVAWSDPNLDPRYHWVDLGPFLDRFGVKALAVTGSSDLQVQGLITLLLPRKYIDLKRADLPGMLDLLVSKSLINVTDKASILNPVTTDYERYIKDMPQPV